ncbi:MAG: trypsin-like peptidase domain-containing protein [Nitrososphaeraceae archaeon]
MNTQEKNRNQMIISSSSVAGIVLLSLVISISLLLEQVFTVYASENQDTPSILQTQKIQLLQQNQSNPSNLSAADTSSLQVPSLTTGSANILNKIFKQTQDSVVQITRTVPQAGIVPDSSQENRTALGSGFLFDNQGHIITNNHVVGDAKTVDVTFTNGDRLRANVTAVDPYIDIAVLKIIGTQNNTIDYAQLKPLPIGNSSALTVGDQVIAIGNPYGLAGTMTTGIVSQVGRLVPAPEVQFSVPDVIQTDASINPGNSGGPLLNTLGEVVGVNFAALQQGLGFAIPMNVIQDIVPKLIEKGNYTHPYLGLTGTTLTSDLAANIENITQDVKGVVVNTLVKGAPADNAGLRGTTTDQYGKKHGGDIIVGIDGKKVTEFEQLVSFLEGNTIPGDKVMLKVLRNGTELDLDAVMGERPSPSSLPTNG